MKSTYEKIVEHLFVSVTVFNMDSKTCLFANPAALEALEVKDLNFKLDSLFAAQVEGHKNFEKDSLKTAGNFTDVIMCKPNGHIFIVNLGIHHTADGRVVITFDDITAHKKLLRELESKQSTLKKNTEDLHRQNQQLIELDKAKDRFFALTSHELRTPLSSIVATSQFIVDDSSLTAAEVRDYVKVILSEGQQLLNLVNDILDFSKIQAGKLELYVEQKNVATLLKTRIEYIEKLASTKSIKINFKEAKKETFAYFDDVRLSQVFDNVLSNAIKYNNQNGSITVEVTPAEEAPFATIAFTDTGIGIPKEFQSKIFNEFETVENVRHHHQATGLGMPISQKLMALMGGKIYFTSEPGIGTTFYLEIPTNRLLSPDQYRNRPSAILEVA